MTEFLDQGGYEKQERLSEEQLFRLLNFTANNDAKLITTAVISSDPETDFTQHDLHKELIARQGDEIAWKPSSGLAYKYCENSLQPAGLVECLKIQGGQRHAPVSAVRATKLGEEFGLAFAGALLDWSIQYPDIPLQRIHGDTHTSGKTRSPEIRFLLLRSLLSNVDQSMSYVDLEESLSGYQIPRQVVEQQLRGLEQLGIISASSKIRHNNPMIVIDSPNPRLSAHSQERQELKPSMQLLFKAIEEIYDEQLLEVDLNTLLARCQVMDPEADLPRLRKLFIVSTHQKSRHQLKSMVRTVEPERTTKKLTAVTINEAYKLPITDLYERIRGVSSGETLEAYGQKAIEIISDPDLFRALMSKTKNFSNNVRGRHGGNELLEKRIISIVQTLGSASVREVQRTLYEEDKVYNDFTVRKALDSFTENGTMEVMEVRPDSSKKTQIRQYRLTS